MSSNQTPEELFGTIKAKDGCQSVHCSPPDWGRVKWRQLRAGERIEKGDWVDMARDGWRDDPKWVPATNIGDIAPDPAYPAHRIFRRVLEGSSVEDIEPATPLHQLAKDWELKAVALNDEALKSPKHRERFFTMAGVFRACAARMRQAMMKQKQSKP